MSGRRAHQLLAYTMSPLRLELLSWYAGEQTLWLVAWLRRLLQLSRDKSGGGGWLVASTVAPRGNAHTSIIEAPCTETSLKTRTLLRVVTYFE